MSVYIIDEKDIPENPCVSCAESNDCDSPCQQFAGYKELLSLLKHKVDLNKAFGKFIKDYVIEMGETATGKIICKTKDGKSFEDYLKEVKE